MWYGWGALVLGLLVASAKSFYGTQNNEVTQLAATLSRVAISLSYQMFGNLAIEFRFTAKSLVRSKVRKSQLLP